MSIKSTAGHVLRTSDDPEAKSLAAYVLQDDAPVQTTKSREDLEALLAKIDGVEGQKERAAAIRATLARMGGE